MNKVILVGNLSKDPTLITTNNGITACRFGLAVSRSFFNTNKERDVDFLEILAWRTLGENCAKYLKKGSKCCVVGQIQKRAYEDDKKIKHYITEIVADEVEFLYSPINKLKEAGENAEPINEPESTGDGTLPF